jgi:predicted ATPase
MPSADPPTWRIPFLRNVKLRDYKSIGDSSIGLGPLTVLVGRNGSGKSNFIDALRFISDSLQTSIDHAIRSRGVIHGLSRRGIADPVFYITVSVFLPGDQRAIYSIAVGSQRNGDFEIASERLLLRSASGEPLGHYHVFDGKVADASINQPPAAQRDRLYLVSASGFPEFRPVYDALSAMRFYDFNVDVMRKPQAPDVGRWLRSDGSNVASVVARLSREQPESLLRIKQYLCAIVPGIKSIERVPQGSFETLGFTQKGSSSSGTQEFLSSSMSDGTLRALGSLIAVAQLAGQGPQVSLVGIEEPETALHPAATAALMDGLREATEHTQVIITSHSPDLLDQMDLETDTLLAVALQDGVTRIAPIDKASRSVIRDHLYTPGELLRMDQLEPDREDLAQQEAAVPQSEGREG